MNERSGIHEKMFLELAEKTIFRQAQEYAYQYLDQAFQRPVVPTEQALADLAHFDEDLPEAPTPTKEILELLHTYGSPATVAQIGGRENPVAYFQVSLHLLFPPGEAGR